MVRLGAALGVFCPPAPERRPGLEFATQASGSAGPLPPIRFFFARPMTSQAP